MNDSKYIGMDVHTATISAAVRDSSGNLVMEATIETKAETILEFVHGLRGSLRVSFEEGTCASWLHDLLKPHVTEVLVCDSRKNALLRVGNKNDREDARKLSELLFLNKLHAVYHGETGIRTLKELARSYLTITRDLTRVMNRLKAIYRGWGIACAGQQVYAPRYRAEWLAKITEAGVRRRAEIYYQQFDALAALRQEVRRELLAESRLQKPGAVCRSEECKADIREVKSPTAGLRFHDLRHHAITELAEGQASEQTIRSIAGHVSHKMLEHYSHIRLDAKRTALDALSQRGTKAGYDTNSGTNRPAPATGNSQVIENNGGREGIRTPGLLVANEEKSEIRHGAAIT